jgi:beta-barrel assembly-enhancing protease
MEVEAWLYDGDTAVRHDVGIGASGDLVVIRFADGDSINVPASEFTHIETRPGCDVYGRRGLTGWRLLFPGGVPAALAEILPAERRFGRWIDRIGLVPATIIGIAISGAVLFSLAFLPKWLAPHVPRSWEEQFGSALVGDFGGRVCENVAGQESLDRLAARLAPGAARLKIRVVDIGISNAVALPGGNIVIFNALLREADGPDEIAGILAHEIAHIERRHVTEAMIRNMGLGLIVAAFGGPTGANVETMLAASYSRDAERNADAEAALMLSRAGISPLPTAEFFGRLAEQEAKLGGLVEGLSYISTHPMSNERRNMFREAARPGRSYRPALNEEEWDALINICDADARS